MSNSILEPIHGVSLFDYAAVCSKMAAGIPQDEVLKALGIEASVYEEVSALWVSRMQADGTFELVTKFGEYFGEVENHPKLKELQVNVMEEGTANLERLKTDRYFYEELSAARTAAFDYGMDGSQWMQDNYGINLGDFQSVTAKYWAPIISNESYEEGKVFQDFHDQKEKEYAAQFAAGQGGNVADDIEF